ncbi:MAG: methylenetetrahydrofolate reductase [NAD(P)H] [Dehalococcoidia bacterium]|nr:methylenetetrahydrofolate reductase [NAD(P)H] [Dehalococcoidia bacterium]
MVAKVSDVLKNKKRTLSFEAFHPKTPKGVENLYVVSDALNELKPDWFSVTYGAGGSTRELTMDLVSELQKRLGVPTMHHLTCVGHKRAELEKILTDMRSRDICNILALRGDPPQLKEGETPVEGDLEYCSELVEMIRRHGDYFSVGVAGFPEGHIMAPDRDADAKYLKLKVDAGGDFVITQLFFNNADYFEYVERLRVLGVMVPILPGILPITSYQKTLDFAARCGANIPQRVHDIFKPLVDDEHEIYKAGLDYAVEQCKELLAGGAPGLHFYSLNKINPTRELVDRLGI